MMRRRSDLPSAEPQSWSSLVPYDSFYARLAKWRDVLVDDEDYASLYKDSPLGDGRFERLRRRGGLPGLSLLEHRLPIFRDDGAYVLGVGAVHLPAVLASMSCSCGTNSSGVEATPNSSQCWATIDSHSSQERRCSR
jgi:hypothetical protein